MPALIGIGLAVGLAIMARISGLDRDRAFYPAVLIAIGTYYILFAAVGGSKTDIATETLLFALFVGLAIVGFRTSLWVVAAGLAAHGVFDLFHDDLLPRHGVPQWWPAFCAAFDVAAGAGLALLLYFRGRRPAEQGVVGADGLEPPTLSV